MDNLYQPHHVMLKND